MKPSERGLALIRQFEGLRLSAYKCAAGTGYAAQIGARSFVGVRTFSDADIDLVRVYDRSLSDAEVTMLFDEV